MRDFDEIGMIAKQGPTQLISAKWRFEAQLAFARSQCGERSFEARHCRGGADVE